jgi:hypothetical protein
MPVEDLFSFPCVVCSSIDHSSHYTLYDIICIIESGIDTPALWAADVGNSWRTTVDIQDNWKSVLNNIDIVGLSDTYEICISFFIFRIMSLLIKQDQVVGMIQIVSDAILFCHLT